MTNGKSVGEILADAVEIVKSLEAEVAKKNAEIESLNEKLNFLATAYNPDGSSVVVWNKNVFGTGRTAEVGFDINSVVKFKLGGGLEIECHIDRYDNILVVEASDGLIINTFNGCGVRILPGNG